jgi:hypothetical protein
LRHSRHFPAIRLRHRGWIAAFLLLLGAGCGQTPPPNPGANGTSNPPLPIREDSPSTADVPIVADVQPETDAEPPTDTTPLFVNVAARVGLTQPVYCGNATKEHILESVGSGCALVDIDNDGWLDIFIVNAWTLDDGFPRKVATKGRNSLYRNLGQGRFAEISQQAGIGGDDWGCGVCAADFDKDGLVDLYVTNFGPNRLYRNLGNGTFEDVGERAGVTTPGWSAGAAFFDADGDGWLDLYVAKYIECTMDDVLNARRTNQWRDKVKVMAGPFGMAGGKDRFFHNNRDGTFTDTTDAVGMSDTAESYGLGVIAADLDCDGDVDVYVGNDSNPNFLYRNDGKGTFTEIGGWSGAGVSADGRPQASMGVDAADFDGDGLPDIVTTNFAQDFSTVYKNEGQLFFTDISVALKMKDFTYVQVSWGCAFLDYDLDSRQDLLILNGHIYPQVDAEPSLNESYKQLPTLLRNMGGKFQNVSRQAGPGLQIPESMRGLAVGDYDNDGRLDLLITAIDVPPLLLHNETTTPCHWLTLRLQNRHGSPAINAVARVTAGGKTQLHEVRSGSTYCSQSTFDLHIGLGNAKEVTKLEIRWPDGTRTVEENVAVDRLHTIRQPKAE